MTRFVMLAIVVALVGCPPLAMRSSPRAFSMWRTRANFHSAFVRFAALSPSAMPEFHWVASPQIPNPPVAEDGKRRTEVRGQKSEVRGQRTEASVLGNSVDRFCVFCAPVVFS